MTEEVILVDLNDTEIGTAEKMLAHKKAMLHRAFSILIFNDKKELLLQKRALTKYHSPGLWTNTCCSHQRSGESTLTAAHRRLKEEMGFDTALKEIFSFVYQAKFDNGLIEHEFDHVLVGNYTAEPIPNSEEVDSFKWITLEELRKDMGSNPNNYTPWFKILINEILDKLESYMDNKSL